MAQQLTENRIAQLGAAPHLVVAQAVCDMLNPSVSDPVPENTLPSYPSLPLPDRNAYIQRHGMFLVCGKSTRALSALETQHVPGLLCKLCPK